MNGEASNTGEVPLRGKVQDPYCCIGNAAFDIFLPILGSDCFVVWAFFVRKSFRDPKLKHTVRSLASATGLGATTVFRSLEILEQLGLLKVNRFGSGKRSECQLFDERELATRLGAVYNRQSLSFSLPPEVAERLKAGVKLIRTKQQGKAAKTTVDSAINERKSSGALVSQRNTSVSLRVRQRSTRETQTGSHLIREERRIEEGPSPTPSHIGELESPEKLSSEDEPGQMLKWAADRFNGAMDNMRAHILDTSRPPVPHFANGYADWNEFGFNSLAVEAATWRGKTLELRLSARDPAAARRGLEKYQRKWEAGLRGWFECQVKVELTEAKGRPSSFNGERTAGMMEADNSRLRKQPHLETVERWFWEFVELQMLETGETEQQVLDRIKTPGFTGLRARQRTQSQAEAQKGGGA